MVVRSASCRTWALQAIWALTYIVGAGCGADLGHRSDASREDVSDGRSSWSPDTDHADQGQVEDGAARDAEPAPDAGRDRGARDGLALDSGAYDVGPDAGIGAPMAVYVDAKSGKDTNPGTLTQPYASIQRAASTMPPGFTCYIRGGTYRETVRPAANNVTFTSYNNERVLITGLDVVQGWTVQQGRIHKAAFTRQPPPGTFKATQLFLDGRPMPWARYPNDDGNMLNRDDMANVTITSTGQVTLRGMPVKPNNSWAGAYFLSAPAPSAAADWWTANKCRVAASGASSVSCAERSMNWWTGDGYGYLVGHLNALDAPREWHLQGDMLYFYPPAGVDLKSATVEARARTYGFDLNGRSNVKLQGLHFKAAALKLQGSSDCIVEKCTVRYASTFSGFFTHPWGDYENGDGGIYVSGSNNVIRDSYIGRTWGHGVSLWGEKNVLENCLVEQADWIGERMALVWSPGDDNIIRRNTIRFGPRDGIELGNARWINKYARRALIQFNHVHDTGHLYPDGGLLYTNHQSGANPLANSEISYNVFHHYHHPAVAAHGGIYLDNASSGYTIHHNLVHHVRKGVQMNDFSNAHDIFIYHNTFIAIEQFAVRRLQKQTSASRDIVVRNNHTNGVRFEGLQVDHNRENVPLSDFANAAAGDYRLVSSSASIDKGVVLPGINDDAVGAPDLGAYELGGASWTAGATTPVPAFPDEP